MNLESHVHIGSPKMMVWRNAASLILTARHGQNCRSPILSAAHNYNLLCIKRHQDSSFMPGSYVFPGGNVDPADSNPKWHELFAAFGFDNDSFTSLTPKATVRPQIFRTQQNELPRDISLRITAIRETFEECGVLMCRRKDDRTFSVWGQHFSLPKKELQMWQKEIHNNAMEFLTFCQKFECYPDLWALHEWNNWLTPTYYSRRYNTAFYLACLQSAPDTEYEASEIADLRWETPENIWSLMDIVLPPPQQYEVYKLAKLKNIDYLMDYAVQRGKTGVEMYMPVRVNLKDDMVHILPGDTMYPKNVGSSHKLVIDKLDVSMDEFREMTPVKHRIESFGIRMTIFDTNDIQTSNSCISQEPGNPKNKL